MNVKNQTINNMCFKYNHAYGLRISEEQRKEYPYMTGFTQQEADFLYKQMEELYDIVQNDNKIIINRIS